MHSSRKNIPLRDLMTYGESRSVRHTDCDYGGDIDVHITICADCGKPFAQDTVAAMVCENIEFYASKFKYRLYGYCLMPDHLHVLLSPMNSGLQISRWLREFKSLTTNRYQSITRHATLWQRSAYDHVCRNGETAESALVYIVNNPVRGCLVQDWEDWPWTKVFIEI